MSDAELIEAVAGGDQAAFAALYDRYAARLLGLIVRVLGSRKDAEDVLQEVFREVWSRADRFDRRLGSPAIWLLNLCRSRSIDYLRHHGSARKREEGHARPERLPATGDAPDLTGRARDALAELPIEQRHAIDLAFGHGLTSQQIADVQGIPLGTAKTRLRLGMGKLRQFLNPQPEEMPA
ncbi:MAG: sigma-70 family RNA polymerase sigma factor [Phycisphaerales bacterium]|nr:sigma-70 family RNA polymerase sigma factor [Phycisphaerae bacterium]NNF42254.1 sigma-70 family RNA polymerase sigma factor [Phycisphaerales bacterium]NNM25661.1 sigma-70 family RNA polymerase sigma factor [Phycisphaerales bacterium]